MKLSGLLASRLLFFTAFRASKSALHTPFFALGAGLIDFKVIKM